MNRKEQQLLDMLSKSFSESAEDIKVPQRLEKENIVKMLEESKKDFSDKTGTIIDLDSKRKSKKSSQTAVIRRSLSVAAMLIVVIGASLVVRMSNETSVTRSEPKLNSYNAENIIKTPNSYEEIQKDFEAVINNKEAAQTQQPSAPADGTSATQPEKNPDKTDGETSAQEQVDMGEYVIDSNVSLSDLNGNAEPVDDGLTSLEADIVKTDGKYLYVLTSGKDEATDSVVDQVKVIRAVPANDMQTVSVITLTGSSAITDECIEIFLKDNTLIAIMSRRSYEISDSVAYTMHRTAALYYDISNPEAIVKTKEFVQDGAYVSAGIYGDDLCLITDNEITSVSQSFIPSYSVDGAQAVIPEDTGSNLHMVENGAEASNVFITLTDTKNPGAPVSNCIFLGCNGDSVIAGKKSVIIARAFVSVVADENGNYNNLTELYRVNITDNSVALTGYGVVEGVLRCEPVIDEATGNILFITTGNEHSSLYVYDNAMQFVGWFDGIAPGKKITGIKYAGNTCYVTAGTQEETTTLIDVSDPAKPRRLEEVATAGFGSNIVGIGNGRFVEISTDSDSMNLRLYDMSSSSGFEAIASFEISGNVRPLGSDAAQSVVYSAENSTLCVPVVTVDRETQTVISSYYVFNCSGDAIKCIGAFEHGEGSVGDVASRCICIGDTLYTVSGETISAFSVSGGAETGRTKF